MLLLFKTAIRMRRMLRLTNNTHLQGVPADVMQVQEDATTNLTRRAVETLEQQLAEASLTDPIVVMQDPLITWHVQVSRRDPFVRARIQPTVKVCKDPAQSRL